MAADQGSRDDPPRATPRSGGRTWWAHFEFTRINIAPIILHKKIEDFRSSTPLMFPVGPPVRESRVRCQLGAVEFWRGW
jgi:hypothetical protein